jgi:hypothetical protein
MAIIDSDLSINVSGDIRWTGDGSTTYTVLELHRWLQDKADDASAAGDDLMDITRDNSSDRSTDNIITLLAPYNIDDNTAKHFYDGSITQDSGDTVYSGLLVVGSIDDNASTPVAAAIQDDGGVFTDETTDANSAAAADVNILPATAAVNDAFYVGYSSNFKSVEFNISTGATGTYTITWEYWDGSAWSALANVTDGTSGFQTTGVTSVTFDQPVDWTTTTVNAQGPFYYIRGRVSAYTSGGGGVADDISITAGTTIQVVQNNALLTNYWGPGLNADAGANILLRIMVKTRVDGADIDGKRLRVQSRELGDTYGEFSLTAGLGNATAAIFTSTDLNNATAEATIAGWTITNTEGFQLVDIDGDAIGEEYYAQWDKLAQSINDVYEYTKYIQRRGTAETIHGMNGELFRGITHNFAYDNEAGTGPVDNDTYAWGLKVDYDNESGTFAVGDAVTIGGTATGRILALDDNGTTGTMILSMESGTPANDEQIVQVTSPGTATADVNLAPVGQATGGGVGTFLAVDDDGTTGNIYMQLIKGTTPSNDAILYEATDAANTIQVNGTVTSRTVSPEFIGTSTGSNIIGAYGISFDPADVGASDQFFDLSNTLRVPPNNVTFTVQGLISLEDRVLVGPEDGAGGLDVDQLSLNTTLSAADESSVVVTTGIPSDTPSSGTIRVELDSGIYKRVRYSSWTGSTFTIIPDDTFVDGNVTVGTDSITLTAHSFQTGDYVQLTSTGTLPAGLSLATDYYVIYVDANTIQLANSLSNAHAGTVVTITAAAGGGTHTVEAMSRNFSSDNAASTNNVFISYIDELADATSESFTSVYNSDRTLFIRVRDGGNTPIKTFETTGTLGSGGGSSTAIRTSDE